MSNSNLSSETYAEKVRLAALTPTPYVEKSKNKGEQSTGFIQSDLVNHPPHYTQGSVECKDALKSALGVEGYKAYCRGACMKYLWRTEHKDGLRDLKKCAWYLNELIEILEEGS